MAKRKNGKKKTTRKKGAKKKGKRNGNERDKKKVVSAAQLCYDQARAWLKKVQRALPPNRRSDNDPFLIHLHMIAQWIDGKFSGNDRTEVMRELVRRSRNLQTNVIITTHGRAAAVRDAVGNMRPLIFRPGQPGDALLSETQAARLGLALTERGSSFARRLNVVAEPDAVAILCEYEVPAQETVTEVREPETATVA